VDAPDETLNARVRQATGADVALPGERIQELWSGYGELRRYTLRGAVATNVVVKRVRAGDDPDGAASAEGGHPRGHPRGWGSARSHQRKLGSYRVEAAFYREFAPRCGEAARVAKCWLADTETQPWCLVLEDLDAAGYSERHTRLRGPQLQPCLEWLAEFHAIFLGAAPEDLWPTGTYWHLDTRPDELAAMAPDDPLRRAAPALDARLRACASPTLVHGDAKVANFCFDQHGTSVAAVDFQYVGGGCGIQDVAYFLGSCLDEDECQRSADRHVADYAAALEAALVRHQPAVDPAAVAAEWVALYPVAWADFCRFLAGWAPDHKKLHRYSAAMVQRALTLL